MVQVQSVFSSFSVNDKEKAKNFYVETLGLDVEEDWMGLTLHVPGGGRVFVYQKDDHQPATFTVLNFIVENIDDAVEDLKEKGATFDQYDLGNGAKTDDKGILRGIASNMGPDIAWFKDPAGNVLSLIQDS